MAEEQVQNEQLDNHQVYLDTIQELRTNSVSRELYNKVISERDAVVKALASGDTLASADSVQVRSLADCRKDFMAPSRSQCEYIEKLLALREAGIREQGEDCFVAYGHKVKPTASDFQSAQQTADIYRECLDIAEGNDTVFMREIYQRMR